MFSFFGLLNPPSTPPVPPTWSDGEFDIEGMPVIAVERTPKDDATLIGYRRANEKIGEWYLPVSPAKHADLVQRFRVKLCKIHAVVINPSLSPNL